MTRVISSTATLLLAVCSTALLGCRAMDTRDIDFTHYQNERRTFYAPQKEARVTLISHAYRWVSGDIRGNCSEVDAEKLPDALVSLLPRSEDSRHIVDTIFLEPAGLFDTDSHELNADGEKRLAQVIERLEGYSNLLHLTVTGHTDFRASVKYNDALSKRRANRVAESLYSLIPKERVRIVASGELNPYNDETREDRLLPNRRVSVTALVSREPQPIAVRKNEYTTNTLCHAEGDDKNAILNPKPIVRLQERIAHSLESPYSERPPLSAGDRIRLIIPEGEELTGVYEVGLNGALEIPFAGQIPVQGLDTRALETIIHDRLIEEQIFRPGMLRVSTTVQEWAPVDILVSGATFDPGRVTINRQKADTRNFKLNHLSGAYEKQRLLSAALQAAGGIRPDADLEQIHLIRNGEVRTIDLRGLFSGRLTKDIPLAAGDQVVVPSSGYFQSDLVRRSQITPPGIRIFISNLSIPASNNTLSAVNSSSTSMPYGTRFLQGLLSSNCVGGTQLTNASRRVVLISRNPLTGRTEVVERSVQQLVSDPERDDINPFLMPNDGIACYDSGVTNFRDVMRTFSDFLAPVLDINGL